ncbi:2-hydroxyacid dehydrogenase [Caballeronia grimmiae]|uniref:2-hydroxyacid dehydrogenase n=1 Tax=Caballeronia grimmiae TaxID=1071679 RepID=UPI0038BD8F58
MKIVTELAPGVNDDVTAVFTFKLPNGIAARLPNLRLAASVGAGADGILSASDLPASVHVTRACDDGLGLSMAQYVVLQVLRVFRDLPTLERQHASGEWIRLPIRDATKCTVGIMGVGQTGSVVARTVASLGFRVVGWTRTARDESDFKIYSGRETLPEFLGQCDFLVCLLPLTDSTRGLLNRSMFATVRKGCYVINAARGGIVVEDDLLAAIDNEELSGAAVDVFDQEPLPQSSPFWRHPKILVTPHSAAQPAVEPVVDQFIENMRRLSTGEPLMHVLNRDLGY